MHLAAFKYEFDGLAVFSVGIRFMRLQAGAVGLTQQRLAYSPLFDYQVLRLPRKIL